MPRPCRLPQRRVRPAPLRQHARRAVNGMKQAVESHRSLRVRARRAGKKKPKEEAPGEPNEIEIILYALLIVAHSGMGVKQLEQWVRKVLLDEARARALREAWKPLSLQDGDEAGWGLCKIGAVACICGTI